MNWPQDITRVLSENHRNDGKLFCFYLKIVDITPAFSVTCIAAIFRHHSTIIFRHAVWNQPITTDACWYLFRVTSMQMSHKFKRSCQWAVIGGFRSVLFAKLVERWMAKDIRYVSNTENGSPNKLYGWRHVKTRRRRLGTRLGLYLKALCYECFGRAAKWNYFSARGWELKKA